jgi:hypothetical protein
MRHDEFRKRLDRLHEVLVRGLHYYTVWKDLLLYDPSKVSWSLQEQNKVLGRFLGFFTPVALALHDMALMEFAKLFDAKRKTASLANLLSAAEQDPRLIPRASAGDVAKVSAHLQENQPMLKRLKRLRNQQLAHVYLQPVSVGPIRNTDLDKLADDAKSAFNLLSTAHDGRFFSWEHSLETADRDTTEILRLLVEEMKRRQNQYDEEMVRIGLEAARNEETAIGRRLTSGELQAIRQSYGLTDEQMQLVEQQYGASSPGPG